MDMQEAYRTVYGDMRNSGCELLFGKYDAKHGSESYMYGINTVMEWIACRAGEDCAKHLEETFIPNMIKSEELGRAKENLCER